MMPLIFKQILDTKDIYFEGAMLIYQEAFPSSERQPLSKIIERITARKSELFV